MAPFLALAGFMGSGKSSVGTIVARELGWKFIELDALVEGHLGKSIAECFADEGEAVFREHEARALVSVLEASAAGGTVVALGGGTLSCEQNRRLLGRDATVVLLDVSPEEAWARAVGSERPLAQEKQPFFILWNERRGTYESCADWIIPTSGKGVAEIAAEVAKLAGQAGDALDKIWSRRLGQTGRPSHIVGGIGALSLLRAHGREAAAEGRRFHVVTDTNVAPLWGKRVMALLGESEDAGMCVVEAGEESKSVAGLQQLWEWLADRRARRDDIVVAVGGGVVGDLAGFAAATYHRGVGLWQVPTSLLAQVDSSVGGKTAINLTVAKNLAGAFYQADLVVIDPDCLTTLPEREYAGALGEVIKHALLASADDMAALERDLAGINKRDSEVLSRLLRRNVWFKASVVEEDEREADRRAILNLGHTTAHALEMTLGYGIMNHGQAVALGLLVALAVSEVVLGLDESVRRRTAALMAGLGLETSVALPPTEEVLGAAGRDKKVKLGASGFVGLRGVGQPEWGLDVSSDTLARGLEVIRR